MALGVWHWLAFLIVAILYAIFGVALYLIGHLRMKKITGLKRTMRTTKDDLAMLRRGDEQTALNK